MKKQIKAICTIIFFLSTCLVYAKDIDISSPHRSISLTVSVDHDVSFRVETGNELLFEVRDVMLDTDKGFFPNRNPQIANIKRNAVNRMIAPEIKEKYAEIAEKYNELIITFKDKSKLQFRVYNDGIAYRFITATDGIITINSEHAEFIFDKASEIIYQQDTNINSDYEAPYIRKKIDELTNQSMGNLPALVKTPSSKNVLFLESNLKNYPCLWLKQGESNLEAHFWNYPKEYRADGNSKNRRSIVSTHDYIAKTDGARDFPWRVFAIGEQDTDLLTNQLVYLLAPECQIKDPSWIKPGWVTFDWWARRGLYGVDFKAGINDQTAKYMIDFAADFGIRYFLFDDGWTYKEDLTRTIDGLNMDEVVKYANSKNVDVMLWVTFDLFDSQMEAALQQFQKWGIKGIKIDFINRSDQEAVDFYWRSAEQCAKYNMVIDYHGAYRPDGLRRVYPNVLTREALIEFEYSGASIKDDPDHHCTLPFIRNVAGPMDYIPGTMNNGTKNGFRMDGNRPMGQGTRAHSMALAVITESPMQMLPDAQSDYYRERECTTFLTQIPVEWDEIVPLKGKVGDYIALARRKGSTWYVAAITDWTPRKMELKLDFLDNDTEYMAEIFKDGANSDIRATDYKREIRKYVKGDMAEINFAPGGGWVAKIFK
ncbi:glycoside hydrolase family 97 protein [uncultured Dysgonomonas sp.]|uniref:Putative alpha-glucosidase n=1 Tax=uncultured Dysgonomonas sp. TaxID=206096 RepID=A0A212JW67_9BACT|nr:glycoside hydrolase family 97 protein [uncultured Dysgonomonas sp.]SBW03643.1 putative alpha-glucosidase [uncultured Dysgonomonas sp.]